MSKPLAAINIILAIGDVIICGLAILAFGWGAWFFGKWWLLLFAIIPLALFNQHSLIVNADLERGEKDESSQ